MAVFQEFLKGRAARQTEELKSSQLTGMLQARNMREAKTRKAERFTGLLEGMVDEQYQPLVQEGGVPGFNLAQTLQKQQGIDKQALAEQASNTLGQALPSAIRIEDNEEWQQFLDWSFPISQDAEMDPATFDRIASMPMKEGQAAIAQMLDIEMPTEITKARPASGINILKMPDGKQKSFDITDPVQRASYQTAIEQGGVKPPSKVISGTPEEFGLKDTDVSKAIVKVSDQIDEANKVDLLHSKALELLDKTPDVNTWAVDVIRLGSDFIAGADALLNAATESGVIDAEGNNLSASSIRDMFKEGDSILSELNVKGAELKSVVTNLAYRQAKANDKGGRVTEPDFKYALSQIGASIGDPVAFRAVLELSRSLNREFTDMSIKSHREMIGDSKLPKTSWSEDVSKSGLPVDFTSGEDAMNAPAGANVPFKGKTYTKQADGTWK